MFISAEVSKDAKPNADGIVKMGNGLSMSEGAPMAVATVLEEVKLKDLWQPKYTVATLKGMKTVAFETPTGNHVYDVVGVNRRDSGGDSQTTTIYSSAGHQVKVTNLDRTLCVDCLGLRVVRVDSPTRTT